MYRLAVITSSNFRFNTTSRPDLYGVMVLPDDLSQNKLSNSVVIIGNKNRIDCKIVIELERAKETRHVFDLLKNKLSNSVVIISNKNCTDCKIAIELERAKETRRVFDKALDQIDICK